MYFIFYTSFITRNFDNNESQQVCVSQKVNFLKNIAIKSVRFNLKCTPVKKKLQYHRGDITITSPKHNNKSIHQQNPLMFILDTSYGLFYVVWKTEFAVKFIPLQRKIAFCYQSCNNVTQHHLKGIVKIPQQREREREKNVY